MKALKALKTKKKYKNKNLIYFLFWYSFLKCARWEVLKTHVTVILKSECSVGHFWNTNTIKKYASPG